MRFTHRFEFKPKVSLPTTCASCKEEIGPKESVALVNGAVHCYHCTNIASYQDYAFYRAKESVVIKQFFDILLSLIFGGAFIVFGYLLYINDPLVSFMPRFVVPFDTYAYIGMGYLILMSPFFGFIHRLRKLGFGQMRKALLRHVDVKIYPDYPSEVKVTKKNHIGSMLFGLLLVIIFAPLAVILMIVRLVQYLDYGAKINRIDDHYLREHRHDKQTKDFNLYVKHADAEQKNAIDKLKLKFGKYPPLTDVLPDPEYHEVFRGLRLYRAYRLRYKLEKELVKKYPEGKFVFVVSQN